MSKTALGLALATVALSIPMICRAASTPEATLKEFLAAAQKKDKKVVRSSIDWPALGKSMRVDQEKDPDKRKAMMDQLQVIFVEVFAGLGPKANTYRVGPVTTKGAEAKGSFMMMDAAKHKFVPKTEFTLHKKGSEWTIYNIASAPTPH